MKGEGAKAASSRASARTSSRAKGDARAAGFYPRTSARAPRRRG